MDPIDFDKASEFKKNWPLGLVVLAVVLIATGLIICGGLDHPQDFIEDDSRLDNAKGR
jgi:hypothetical protein